MRDVFEIDIPCDPTQIDDTGLPWTFLDEATHPERIVVGATVVTGDEADPVFARVVSMTRRPSGVKVHLEVLPGDPLAEIEGSASGGRSERAYVRLRPSRPRAMSADLDAGRVASSSATSQSVGSPGRRLLKMVILE